jgi:hypothetical protein
MELLEGKELELVYGLTLPSWVQKSILTSSLSIVPIIWCNILILTLMNYNVLCKYDLGW